MQARFRASGGMPASVAGGMATARHQQGGCGKPVLRASAMAQTLAWPHSGQVRGSGEVAAMGIRYGTDVLDALLHSAN